ncbi:hypothetical protein RFI_16028 [Reticulomyxa filosa]|uniref:Uncharacterized protein n=1 Tax=Reticulomyxa filosa TaxID=46433 RepID=X6N554_RETFI|nr:hypothetical protein RFI_16028 [Reticulomyxa filosa]|eukprot:ETO21176.1 hypothetical protein RFI_16028 [Reticulomyxa filosa]
MLFLRLKDLCWTLLDAWFYTSDSAKIIKRQNSCGPKKIFRQFNVNTLFFLFVPHDLQAFTIEIAAKIGSKIKLVVCLNNQILVDEKHKKV